MFRFQVCYIISCEIPKLLRLKSAFFALNGKCHVFLAGEIQCFVPGPASHLCGAEKTAEALAQLAQAQGTEPWAYTKGMGLM